MSKKILVIATHPDDEVLGCGGVIARHVAEGDSVAVLVVTRGATDVFTEESIAQVWRELRVAQRVLGYSNIHTLDFPAPKLDTVPGHVLADAIGKVIRAVAPHTIYLPHYGDLHGDHRAVYLATLVAARPISNSPVKRLLCYETLSETDWAPPTNHEAFVPTVYVDISLYLQKKLEAFQCYQTQLKEPPNPRSLQAIEALARVRGATVSFSAVEAFILVREVI